MSAPLSALSQVRPIAHETLTERVYRDLRELIMSGQVQPGERLTLKSMAQALGTSQMPVREAIRQLAAEKALEILPNRAVRVPVMSKARFSEILMIRLALEGLAVEHACANIADDELTQVERLASSFADEVLGVRPNINRLIQVNKRLHFAIYNASRLPALVEMIESLWLQIGPVLNLDLRSGSLRLSHPPSVKWHAKLVKAVCQRDAVAARAALAGDLKAAAEVILSGEGLSQTEGRSD